ncbi:hypothetical protein K2P97_11990 [bacterium]|nr:hypothetical protein [bacterium]
MLKVAFKIFFLISFVGSLSGAQSTVLNEVLFSVGGVSWTARDRQLYETVIREVYTRDKISKFSLKTKEDFLISRLSAREAEAFDLQPEKNKTADAVKKKFNEFSAAEIESEVNQISKALTIVELKENQLKQQDRFDAWVELLKRKYQVKIKSNELK